MLHSMMSMVMKLVKNKNKKQLTVFNSLLKRISVIKATMINIGSRLHHASSFPYKSPKEKHMYKVE